MNFAQTLTGDPLDLLTKAALGLLAAIMLVMLVQHQLTASPNAAAEAGGVAGELRRIEQQLAQDKVLYQDVAALAEQRQHEAALDKLKEVQAAQPDKPRSFLWQAQLQYDLGQIADALTSYRQAIDREPGYIDRKSPLFVGKNIKKNVLEAKDKLQREVTLKPNDPDIKRALNELLYVQRRLAGGCE
jgi:tetratricopeptide (TPR) repeat protein